MLEVGFADHLSESHRSLFVSRSSLVGGKIC